MNSVLQYVQYVAILVAFAIPLGFYMSKVMDGEKTIVSRVLGPVERGIYKLLRIDPEEDMGWKKYLAAALLSNLFGFMKQTALRAFGLVLVMTVLCGFLYTVVCTGINQTLFPIRQMAASLRSTARLTAPNCWLSSSRNPSTRGVAP